LVRLCDGEQERLNMRKQIEVELQRSKKYRRCMLIDYIDIHSNPFNECIERINQYMNKEYSYESKNKRIAYIKDTPKDEILLTILIETLSLNTNAIHPMMKIVVILSRYLDYENEIDGIKSASELVAICEGAYYELYHPKDPLNPTGSIGIKSLVDIPETLQAQLEQLMYLPPMKCTPLDWINNFEGGYLTINDSILLNCSHDYYLNYDAINKLQKVTYQLNSNILNLPELPTSKIETLEQLTQFNKLVDDSKVLYEEYKNIPFWFVWKYDKRGRIYSQGYHINIQSTEYKRALIDFADTEQVEGV